MAEEPMIYMGKIVSNLIKLLPYDFQDLKIFWGLEEELNDLQESMDEVADLVEDAEEKQDHMVQARRWLRKLRDEAYEAENLLSQLAYETTRFKILTKKRNDMSITSSEFTYDRKIDRYTWQAS
ncbi:hypothetical protein M5689_002260 [Euphorbia peplus]|nr:hypothetical protein M5689_002260 [Euphorbia peplus]